MALGIGDIIRTTVNFTLVGGDQYQNVYHHYCDMVGGWSDSAVVDEIELWVEAMYGEIVSSMKMIAEGISTTLSVHHLAKREDVEMPICEQIYKVLYENKDPRTALQDLMSRKLKSEH